MKHTIFLNNENTKKNTCLSCLKSFSKREVIGKLCIEEVRVDLEHLCSCSRKQCKKIHGSFSVNNYPLVYIHCIIKIMCQCLTSECLICLFGVCSRSEDEQYKGKNSLLRLRCSCALRACGCEDGRWNQSPSQWWLVLLI